MSAWQQACTNASTISKENFKKGAEHTAFPCFQVRFYRTGSPMPPSSSKRQSELSQCSLWDSFFWDQLLHRTLHRSTANVLMKYILCIQGVSFCKIREHRTKAAGNTTDLMQSPLLCLKGELQTHLCKCPNCKEKWALTEAFKSVYWWLLDGMMAQ